MNKLKEKLRKTACIGFRSNKEDCNVSNFSEFHTVDSGIVSDQSSRKELPNISKPNTEELSPENQRPASSTIVLHNKTNFVHLSSIKEHFPFNGNNIRNKTSFTHTDSIDFGPLHPYMKAVPFINHQYSDAYNTVASSSADDSQSILSELFVPLNRTLRNVPRRNDRKSIDRSQWASLPSNVLIRIFKYLFIHDVRQCSQVCTNWYFIAWQPAIWHVVDLSQEHRSVNVNVTLRNVLGLIGGMKHPLCPLIHTIKLDKCAAIDDDSLILISNSCQNLRNLSVKRCYLISNIALFNILTKCKLLTRLNVEGCRLISSINTLPDFDTSADRDFCLDELNISNCPLIDDSSLSILTHKFRGLNKLLIRNCKRITIVGVEYIARYCSHLQELSLNNIPQITDDAVQSVSLKINANLNYLSLANCSAISDISLNHLADNCQTLRYLNLHKCRRVTDSGIMYLAISLQSSLVSLSISHCHKITNKGVSVLSRYCSNIQQLDLNHCVKINDDGLEEACRHFLLLTMIDINDTSATVKSFELISKKFSSCSIQHRFITDC